MAPFNMRCVTCGEYIYKGKKFNARKEDVENETYLGIRIYRFYIKCTRCLQEISFKTDPQNTDYVIEAGATRNFMALKLAEEQARREEQELREEEANNPMKLLENRTEQSRNEIELLESLEELKDLNRRHQNVDYEEMLEQYNDKETPEQREARLAKLDEDYIRTIKFGAPSSASTSGTKRVIVEEEIIEETTSVFVDPMPVPVEKRPKLMSTSTTKSNLGALNKLKMQNLVKKKTTTTNDPPAEKEKDKKYSVPAKDDSPVEKQKEKKDPAPAGPSGGLSLLAAYSDQSDSEWPCPIYLPITSNKI